MIDNLRFVFFTVEERLPILNLALKYYLKHSNIKVSVIFNKMPADKKLLYTNRVEYLDGESNITTSERNHFTNSLKNTLPKIKEDYIFYFCDDYFLIKDIKIDDLNKLMKFIVNEDIDYFGFEEVGTGEILETSPYISKNYLFDTNTLRIKNNNYRYLYSVQPTIWKKKSLFDLSNKFPDCSIHHIDETTPSIRESNKFKCMCNTLKSHFTYEHTVDDYFIISYVELTRHGVFNHPRNNCPVADNTLSVNLINNLIEEENLLKRPEYSRFFL